MVAKFYNCQRDERYVQKLTSGDMQYQVTVEILTPNNNVIRPQIRVEAGIVNRSVNYVWLKDLKRFYYIRNWKMENGYVTMDLEVDVLMSFRKELMSSRIMIKRNEFQGNNYLTDDNLQINAPTRVKITEFPKGFDKSKQIFYLALVSGQGAS